MENILKPKFMKKIVLGLSGGMDSTTLLGYYVEQGFEVHCCNFQYGSKQNSFEEKSVQAIIAHYTKNGAKVFLHSIHLEETFKDFTSNLLNSGGEIPEGHYEAEVMRLTVVPGRNMIFGSIMAGLAESLRASLVALGVHSGDHYIYADCREEFIKAFSYAAHLSSDSAITIQAPFINDDKTSILARGFSYKIPVPYHLTRTCYTNHEKSCGKCGSCFERLEAFNNLNKIDPISYE